MPRPALPRPVVPAAGLVALVLALSGCGVDSSPARALAAGPGVTAPASTPAPPSREGSPSPSPSAPAPAPSAPAPSTPPPSTAGPAPAGPAPASPAPAGPAPVGPAPVSPAPSTPAPSGSATPGGAALPVSAVQRRLTQLRYYAGPVDGRSGPATRSAVMAFQKVHGLPADGVVGPRTRAALAAPRTPTLRLRFPADRVEVDLDRQVLHVVEDGRIVRTLPVSSGSGASYRQPDGSWARALTPVGTYRIERRIVGVRRAPLGILYDPQYFHRGWAIHGSDSVPAVPASHGCVRVTRADAQDLVRLIGVGTTVHLHGGTHVFPAGSRAAGTGAPGGDAPAA